MATVRFIICLVVVAMDVAAGILSLEAEYAKNKASWGCVEGGGRRRREHDHAFEMAVGAAVLLTVAHITTNLVGGCTCICSMDDLERSSSRNRQLWFACLIFSWIDAAIGLPMLIIGMVEDWKWKSAAAASAGCMRWILHQHFLSIAGVMCFLHALLSIAFYASYIVISLQTTQTTTTSSCSNNGHHEAHLHL